MGEDREIFWESLTLEKIQRILDYLLEEWGTGVAAEFYSSLMGLAVKLSKKPQIGTRVTGSADRYSFPFKYYRLVYYFNTERIIFINLIDMRSSEELKQ